MGEDFHIFLNKIEIFFLHAVALSHLVYVSERVKALAEHRLEVGMFAVLGGCWILCGQSGQ